MRQVTESRKAEDDKNISQNINIMESDISIRTTKKIYHMEKCL